MGKFADWIFFFFSFKMKIVLLSSVGGKKSLFLKVTMTNKITGTVFSTNMLTRNRKKAGGTFCCFYQESFDCGSRSPFR